MTRSAYSPDGYAGAIGLISDFDGPIADVSERYYRVYHDCLDGFETATRSLQRLSKSEFWRLKRARVPERRIGEISGLPPALAREFAAMRGRTVHSAPYLHYDRPIPGAVAALERAQQAGIELTLMTMRRDCELAEALSRFNVARFFPPERRYCIGDAQVKTADTQDKPRLMERAVLELPEYDVLWMVGDTEADAIAASTYRVPFIAVLSGIRDRPRLMPYRPCQIVGNLSEAVDSLLDATERRAG